MPREHAKNFAEETPFHGLVYIANGRNACYRFVWSTIFIGAFVGFAYQSGMSVLQYIKEEPSTTYSINQVQRMNTPNVILCPTARFSKKKIKEYGISNNLTDYIHVGFPSAFITTHTGYHMTDVVPDDFMSTSSLLNLELELQTLLRNRNVTFIELVRSLSFVCKDLVKDCWFQGNRMDCCGANVKYEFLTMAVCPRLQGVRQSLGGPGRGIVIRMDVPLTQFYSGPNILHNEGIVLKLAFGDEPEMDMTLIPSGSRTQVSLGVTTGQYLSTKKNPCITESVQKLEDCIAECVYSNLYSDCPCNPLDVPSKMKNTKPICSPAEIGICMINDRSANVSAFIDVCQKACPKPCKITRYTKTVTSFP